MVLSLWYVTSLDLILIGFPLGGTISMVSLYVTSLDLIPLGGTISVIFDRISLGGSRWWKIMTAVVALPGVVVCYINAQIKEKEDHEIPRAEFIPYTHLRLRSTVSNLESR